MLMTLVILVLCTALPVLGVAHIAESRRRGRAEREALESERRFRQLAESSFDMIVRFEPRTQQRSYISPAVRRLYGYEPDEAMKLSADEVIHPEDLPNVREALHRLEHADHEPVSYRGRRKDGSYIWVEASLTRWTDQERGTPDGVTVGSDLPPDLPRLQADEGKTRQVFFNLVSNAVKFTPAGGRIDISARFDRERGLAVTVADTGIGIAPEDLNRVLEPFVQVDSSLSRRHQGTGLGLPAVKGIMELHRGTIELQSTLGRGTRATITFPPDRAVLEPALTRPQPAV